ncbi:Gldg family protein [Haloimpatiens sp. FM7330]|uniref:Gldg family protein n=1 Tax=Haloimpatiens sp. FM7330 TaxID=3298610 RepID=UPI0036262F11
MKKLDILKSFKNKKFKYGSLSTLMIAIFLSILIIINLLVGKLNLNKDLTKNKMFSLSQQTYKILNNVKEDIKIYAFYRSGQENYAMSTVLDQYKNNSKKISVEYVDPNKKTQIGKKFIEDNTKITDGTLVVEGKSKFKVIDSNELFNYNYSNPYNPTPESIAVEQNITSAISYVTSDKSTIVYTLQGHDESEIPSQVSKQLALENYSMQPINLSIKGNELKENSILLISSPKRDLSSLEVTSLKNYLSKGGKAIFLMDLIKDDLPNFQSILNTYGITTQKAMVVEGNTQYVSQNPLYLLPKQEDNDILNSLNNNKLRVLIPGCQNIKISKSKDKSLDIESLLVTTNNSWAKTNLEATTIEKEKGDLNGPFNIAVSVTNNSNKSKLIVVSNSTFISSQINSLSNSANLDFFMNSINWLQNKKQGISIRPKILEDYVLQISVFDRLLFSGIVVIIIPLIILIMGLRTWLKRRKK